MHDFEKEYEARFKAAKDRSGVDEDALWERISAEMPLTAPKEGDRYKFWILLPLLFGLSSLFGDWPVDNQSQVIASQSELVTQQELGPVLATGTEGIEPFNAVKESQEETPTAAPIALSATEAPLERLSSSSLETEINVAASPLTTSNLSSEGNSVVPETIAVASHETAFEQPSQTAAMISALGSRSIPALVLTDREIPHPAPKRLPLGENQNSRFKGQPFSFGIHAGLFRMQGQFEGHESVSGYNRTLANAHRADGGFSLELMAHLRLGNRWSVTTGLGYHTHYATFDMTQSRDTMIWRDNVPGSELVDAIAERRVRHQQALQWVSLPFLIGTKSRNDRLLLGVQAGLGLNYILKQSGRSLSPDGEFITYGQGGQAADPFNDFFMSTHLELQLGYELREGLDLILRPRLAYQIHGQSAAYELRHSTTVFGINLGLIWR